MSKFLSKVGIGSAEVDTILPTDSVVLGESLDARVEIEGGSSEQDIDHINFGIATKYQTDEGKGRGKVDKFHLNESFTISPGEERTEHVTIHVPYETPLTMGWDVWIKTGLDIDWALDPKDKDYIEVLPDERLQALVDAVEALGFSFYSSDVERGSYRHNRKYVQELEYRPRGGPFNSDLDELELVPMASEEAVDVVVEVDKRGGLLEEMADVDESKTRMRFDHTDSEKLQEELRSKIRRNI